MPHRPVRARASARARGLRRGVRLTSRHRTIERTDLTRRCCSRSCCSLGCAPACPVAGPQTDTGQVLPPARRDGRERPPVRHQPVTGLNRPCHSRSSQPHGAEGLPSASWPNQNPSRPAARETARTCRPGSPAGQRGGLLFRARLPQSRGRRGRPAGRPGRPARRPAWRRGARAWIHAPSTVPAAPMTAATTATVIPSSFLPSCGDFQLIVAAGHHDREVSRKDVCDTGRAAGGGARAASARTRPRGIVWLLRRPPSATATRGTRAVVALGCRPLPGWRHVRFTSYRR